MLRLSWTQPEDLVPHGLRAAELDGCEIADLAAEWSAAGGSLIAPVNGATPHAASTELRTIARRILAQLDERQAPVELRRAEPNGFDEIVALATPMVSAQDAVDLASCDFSNRVRGAWLGRAAGCLLGKPVEKIPRAGIRAIAESTGNWPIASYFTEIGLDEGVAALYPWNRRSRPTSLVENIDGMPEDDDLNFPLIALDLLERRGSGFETEDVALSWLANLPGGRVFTAERIVYRNLLDGYEPEIAGTIMNPFQDWIGAQIRTDVYGWVAAGRPCDAARMAWHDARLSHARSGLYGALFAAAACSAAVVASSIDDVIGAGLSVVPSGSRYAEAIRFGVALAESEATGEVTFDEALDLLEVQYGHLHWVHALNNSALLAFALKRGDGDFERTITTAVSGGWDTDSVGATAGSIAGALCGANDLSEAWIAPLQNRLASTVPGFDAIGFDTLAARTVALARSSAASFSTR